MATTRIEVQELVKKIRRAARCCTRCTRSVPQGLVLGGTGPTLSELVRTPGMTPDDIREIIAERSLVCRKCLNKSTVVSDAGASNPESRDTQELLNDPDVRRVMFEKGVPIAQEFLDRGIPQIGPEDGGGGDSNDSLEGDPYLDGIMSRTGSGNL